MATLPATVKLHIITALACFDTPTQVAESVKERFGLEVSRQRIEAYHPERCAGARLDAKWRLVFEETRERYRAELADIPIVHRSHRLRALGRMLELAERMNNHQLAGLLLEQAAREMGGMYVNHRPAYGRRRGTGLRIGTW